MKNAIKSFAIIFIFSAIFFLFLSSRVFALEPVQPNDPYFRSQPQLKKIRAPEAWSLVDGRAEVVVAVIDVGVDIDHEDLRDTIWRNTDEISGNGIDDDKNGFVDDVHGWNFVEGTNDPQPQFAEGYEDVAVSHGTWIAGIIGARKNNGKGIAGLASGVTIMPIRAVDDQGRAKSELVVRAIQYATENGTDVISMSFVIPGEVATLERVLHEAYRKNVVLVASTGNDGQSTGSLFDIIRGNVDIRPVYPVCYDGANNEIIGVGSVELNDEKSLYSNFGMTCLDIHAPGANILSTQFYDPARGGIFQKKYTGFWSGTSFATPYIAATAALLLSEDPTLSNSQIRDFILASGQNINEENPLFARRLGAGRVDVFGALLLLNPEKRASEEIQAPKKKSERMIMRSGEAKAAWIRASIPKKGGVKTIVPASVLFKNIGDVVWDESFAIHVEVTGVLYEKKLVTPVTQTVPPGATLEFQFSILVPEEKGYYPMTIKIVDEATSAQNVVTGGVLGRGIWATEL